MQYLLNNRLRELKKVFICTCIYFENSSFRVQRSRVFRNL